VARFGLSVGATINIDGAALYNRVVNNNSCYRIRVFQVMKGTVYAMSKRGVTMRTRPVRSNGGCVRGADAQIPVERVAGIGDCVCAAVCARVAHACALQHQCDAVVCGREQSAGRGTHQVRDACMWEICACSVLPIIAPITVTNADVALLITVDWFMSVSSMHGFTLQ
jgi:hypothetical protein